MDGISESEVPFLFFKAADRVQGLFASKLWFLSDSRVLWYTNLTLSEREKGTHDER